MYEHSFWDIANSTAVSDGFRDAAYGDIERELIRRINVPTWRRPTT
jgi:hypothetical protein